MSILEPIIATPTTTSGSEVAVIPAEATTFTLIVEYAFDSMVSTTVFAPIMKEAYGALKLIHVSLMRINDTSPK